MSHLHRFYAPGMTDAMPEIILPEEEAHHALRAARLHDGDTVAVFNGAGLGCSGTLRQTGRRSATVVVGDRYLLPPPRVAMTLAVGGLHRDKPQEEVIRRAAELGASRVCFWRAEYSQRPITPSERWLKAAVEACKQCGRPYLPAIDAAVSLDAFLESYNGPVLIAATCPDAGNVARLEVTDRLALLVGPEGDFSEREIAAARSRGAVPVQLGDYVYRTEAAAALLATLVADRLGMLGPGLEISVNP